MNGRYKSDTMIRLRPMHHNDLGDSYCCMSERETAQLLNRQTQVSFAGHVQWFKKASQQQNRLLFTIEDNNGQYAGTCGFNNIDCRKKQAELWIVIDKYSRGYGYGLRATDALLHYGFYDLGFTVIYLHVLAHNIPAVKLYLKLGFRKTARELQDCGPHVLPQMSIRMELARINYRPAHCNNQKRNNGTGDVYEYQSG